MSDLASNNAGENPEIVEVDTRQIACDGGGGALGHPRIYLNIGAKGFVVCPYCDRHFVLVETQ